jgi:hydroxymethylpyrimidine/phosphomethylpyrimidine kinase
MITLILLGLGILFAVFAVTILVVQNYQIKKGVIVVDPEYNGPEQVSVVIHTIIRYLLKQSVLMRKFILQYVFHVLVRAMYHFDILTTKMYAKSRNWFVRNAVKNKGTVPHFWEHLKVYKQEMDQEKEQEEAIK